MADVFVAALKLSLLGSDRWGDVDRWVRNWFAECQLTDMGWFTDGHLDCAVGSFSGWPSANDFVQGTGWADVLSHIPYRGQVDVKMKQDLDLEIRLAEWVKPEETRCTVDGAPHRLTFSGRYAQVGPVKAGKTVTLTFPIFERTDCVIIEKRPYTRVRLGNEVVWIDPPGTNGPLYLRGYYRQGETLWQNVRRFVPAAEIPWC